MGTFARKDIVLFPFPYTDLSNRKLRPCLVLSDEMKDDILLCQITSQLIAKDVWSIVLAQTDTNQGNLVTDSFIRTNMLFTASISQIHRRIDAISSEKYRAVIEKIKDIINE